MLRNGSLFSAFSLIGTIVLVTGCASNPSTTSIPSRDSNNPQVFLAGANIEQAKGLAMGSAVSKGWGVASSSDSTLVLERQLNEAAAESVAPGLSRAPTPPRVQVTSDFYQRDGGVDVVLSATVVAADPEKGESRQDFTETYRDDLERSLASLHSTWSRSRGVVASAAPPIPASTEVPLTPNPDVPLAPLTASTPPPADAVAAPEPEPEPGTGVGIGLVGASAATAAPVVDVSGSTSAPASASVPDTTSASDNSAPVPASENMMAMNQPAATGVWAYYAEHYARVRGCSLAGDGAVLVEKKPDYEMHRVYCEGGKTFLVRCNAGICRGMR